MTGAGRLGVVGTLVWDRIVPLEGEPVERWGGIGYSLAAVAAVLPAGWTIHPIVKVGRDLGREARDLLATIPRLDPAALHEVPEPNNRVELRYTDDSRRTEHLTGGVPGWSAGELQRVIDGCDALLVNYIAGWETTLETAESVLGSFGGPVYADLHSLVLGVAEDGMRVPRPLPDWRRWTASFTWLQMTDAELGLLGEAGRRIEEVLETGPDLVSVTRGPDGATIARRDTEGRPLVSDVTVTRPRVGDPTGCGDVWAATMCASLLAGREATTAAKEANRVAAECVDHVGVEGLYDHLLAAVDQNEGGELL